MDNQKHTPGPYTVTENSGSYQNIFLDGKIWMGSVENSLAIEICNKLNERLELLQEVEFQKTRANTNAIAFNEQSEQIKKLEGLLNDVLADVQYADHKIDKDLRNEIKAALNL